MTETVPEEWAAVFFDIGGVIVNLPSIRAGYAAYLQEFATEYDLDPERAIDAWRETLGEHFKAAEGNEYRTASDGYTKAFDALVDADLTEADWRPGFEATTREAMEPEPHVVKTIETLDEAGLYLGIISDIDTWEAHRMLDTFGLDEAFDGITTSEAVGYKKPDDRIFDAAIDEAEVDPARSLYVGDRYEHDMQGGQRAGLWTVAYGDRIGEDVADDSRDGHRVVGDPAVDFFVEDHRELLEIVGVDE
ncbi:HAD family hydrolase [Halorientalis brevis]|uniref:HAD family hydrolase n=1 Tax=Halorientalis brevis TaxID=1126241 RepID=A0ABD6CD74_9EURY|nr:HAD family hydrolase [Halorientalis brevis]